MRTRPFLTAAVLLAATLGAAACDPSGPAPAASTQAAPPAASSAPASASPAASSAAPAKSSAAPAGGGPVSAADETAFERASQDVGGCQAYYKAHKVIAVQSADKSGTLTGMKQTATCGAYGLALDDEKGAAAVTLHAAAGAKATYFTGEGKSGGPKFTARTGTFADFAAKQQTCKDHGDNPPAGTLCVQSLFEYTLDSSGAVTSLRETFIATD
ncbi:hypothetical protein AB0K51_19340 [Kitasatospora sp. NPDC049285]|uniref:hypothetical protein n=1 Tax=Kitasatospora sp. NPDC049285 TaxID=3157096 RepID=UPI00343547C6